jgi:hypothetical protein
MAAFLPKPVPPPMSPPSFHDRGYIPKAPSLASVSDDDDDGEDDVTTYLQRPEIKKAPAAAESPRALGPLPPVRAPVPKAPGSGVGSKPERGAAARFGALHAVPAPTDSARGLDEDDDDDDDDDVTRIDELPAMLRGKPGVEAKAPVRKVTPAGAQPRVQIKGPQLDEDEVNITSDYDPTAPDQDAAARGGARAKEGASENADSKAKANDEPVPSFAAPARPTPAPVMPAAPPLPPAKGSSRKSLHEAESDQLAQSVDSLPRPPALPALDEKMKRALAEPRKDKETGGSADKAPKSGSSGRVSRPGKSPGSTVNLAELALEASRQAHPPKRRGGLVVGLIVVVIAGVAFAFLLLTLRSPRVPPSAPEATPPAPSAAKPPPPPNVPHSVNITELPPTVDESMDSPRRGNWRRPGGPRGAPSGSASPAASAAAPPPAASASTPPGPDFKPNGI